MRVYENLTITRNGATSNAYHSDYTVFGDVSGYTDEQLLDICDRCNFGGRVTRYGNDMGASVTTYND